MAVLTVNKLDTLKIIFLSSVFFCFSQGALYPSGSIFSQAALVTIIVVSSYFFLKVLLETGTNKNVFLIFWSLFLFLNILGFLFTLDPFNYTLQSQLKAILLFSLSFYSAYYLSRHAALTEKDLVIFFLLMLPVLLINFELQNKSILAMRVSDNENVVNNISYSFVALIPYVFLIKNRLISVLIAAVLIYIIIEGAKRGAILVGSFAFFMFSLHSIRTTEGRHRIKSYLGVFVGISVLLAYAISHFSSSEFLVQRMESISEGSGRTYIFNNLLSSWSSHENVLNILFGSGFMSTVNFSGTGNLAHNDWLELLTNYGLLGFFLYFAVFTSGYILVIKKTSRVRERDEIKKYKLIAFTILSMCFLTTMFSMIYNNFSSIYYVILLGFLLAKLENSKG